MKKKIVFFASALFLAVFVNLSIRQESISLNKNSFSLTDVIKITSAQAESGDSYICTSGGPGSTSCSTSVSGGGGGISGGTSCSVTCSSGYYACCNAYHNKCQCRKS
jgi:hypothetical protein